MNVGFSGHQRREGADWEWMADELRREIGALPSGMAGLCSLAAGADQIFAEVVLECGGHLIAIVPRDDYISFFQEASARQKYQTLLQRAQQVVELHDNREPERSFFEAGRYIVNHSDILFAAWDEKPAAGFGGTADIVTLAIERDQRVLVMNPISKKSCWRGE